MRRFRNFLSIIQKSNVFFSKVNKKNGVNKSSLMDLVKGSIQESMQNQLFGLKTEKSYEKIDNKSKKSQKNEKSSLKFNPKNENLSKSLKNLDQKPPQKLDREKKSKTKIENSEKNSQSISKNLETSNKELEKKIKSPEKNLHKTIKSNDHKTLEKPLQKTKKKLFKKSKTRRFTGDVEKSEEAIEELNESATIPINSVMDSDSLQSPKTDITHDLGSTKSYIEPQDITQKIPFSLDFLQFPWKFNPTKNRPLEQNLKCPVDISQIIFENEVISIIKTFLFSIEDFDFETLEEILEPSFHKKLHKNLLRMQEAGYQPNVSGLKKKNEISLEIYNISTIFGVGLSQNRLKNDGIEYFDKQNATINDVPCVNCIHKSMEYDSDCSIFIQIDGFFESQVKINIIKDGKIVKEDEIGIHNFKLETILLKEKYGTFSKKTLGLQQGELDFQKEAKKYEKFKFYLIDFDGFMEGNEIIPEKIIR